MSVTAIVPGSFDPATNGHVDVITRAATSFDLVVVACMRNVSKNGLFDLEERVDMLGEILAPLDNVKVEVFEGLLVDFCRTHDVRIIVKGLRAVSDFEYELQMAQMNSSLGDVETFFITASPEHSFLSSSLVKEVARFGGDISEFVPPVVARRLASRFLR